MLGSQHPDVEALSFRCQDSSLAHSGPIEVRPMFYRSWRIILEAATRLVDLVPLDLWKSTASGSMPPFLIWSTNPDAQSARLERFRVAAAQLSTTSQIAGTAANSAEAISPAPKIETATLSRTEIASKLGLPINALADLLDFREPPASAEAAKQTQASRTKK